MSVLLVEQNARAALEIVSEGYLIENGRVVMHGTAEALKANSDIQEFYAGRRGRHRFSQRQALQPTQALAELRYYSEIVQGGSNEGTYQSVGRVFNGWRSDVPAPRRWLSRSRLASADLSKAYTFATPQVARRHKISPSWSI